VTEFETSACKMVIYVCIISNYFGIAGKFDAVEVNTPMK